VAPFPKVDFEFSQERLGVNAVAAFAAANNLIWRENNIKDVGIDGQLEFVNAAGMATGRMIALQIKSGPSFFGNDEGESWRFYPEEKHRIYWERFPIPVILVLHQPETGERFWIDIRHTYRRGAQDEKVGISIPKAQTLSATTGAGLFENIVVSADMFMDSLEDILRALVNARSIEASFPLSYFQLFAGGLTNIVRSLHFGMDLVSNTVEMNLAYCNSDFGMGLGAEEYDFVFGYVKFLVAQDLADIDFGDCLIDWNDREMVPRFVAPLTKRGRELVTLIGQKEDQLRSAGLVPDLGLLRVAQEHLVQMVVMPSDVERVPLTSAFEAHVLATL
jgi:hypothetical protein